MSSRSARRSGRLRPKCKGGLPIAPKSSAPENGSERVIY
jgi:hypothetical protein